MTLSPAQLRRGMRLSVIDAICYALMVGLGEVFFVADGVRLGASALDLALLVALPLCLGAAGPIIALATLARLGQRRPIVVAAAGGQAAVLAALAVAERTHALTPPSLIALAVLYQTCGQAAGAVWSSWYGDLVPARIRGRYFSRRSRAAHASTCLAVIAGGLALHGFEPAPPGSALALEGGAGYAAIFAAAAACRAISAALLLASPEPRFGGLPGARETLSHLRSTDARPLRRLVGVAVAMQMMVYVGSPYFAPFMLDELGLSYAQYTAATIAVVLAKALTTPAWGHAIDRHDARAAYALAAMLVALVPLPWLFAEGMALVLLAQAMSGFAWGGHEVAHFSLLLERASPRLRPSLFAGLNTLTGAAQLAGALLGGLALSLLGGKLRLVFGVSMVGRLLVAAAIPLLVHHAGAHPPIGRRRLLLRIVGFRPAGGVEARPISMPISIDESDDAEAAPDDADERDASRASRARARPRAPDGARAKRGR